jgi:hypothetical protein
MSETDRALCRKAANECIELARATADTDTKELLLIRAQEWLKLAYADHESKFNDLLAEFNTGQMLGSGLVQHQPMQQQQSRTRSGK